jgi:hypothetical protein
MAARAPAVAAAAVGLMLALVCFAPASALASGPARSDVAAVRAGFVASPRTPSGAEIPPLATGTLGHRLRVYFARASTIVLLVVLVLCSLVLVLLRRRATRSGDRRRSRTAGEQ